MQPVKYVRDPFRGGDNLLCLCECLDAKTMKPIATNKRADANKVFEQKEVKSEEPWYGIEQEYTLFGPQGVTPLGWPNNGFPAPQGLHIFTIHKYKVYILALNDIIHCNINRSILLQCGYQFCSWSTGC